MATPDKPLYQMYALCLLMLFLPSVTSSRLFTIGCPNDHDQVMVDVDFSLHMTVMKNHRVVAETTWESYQLSGLGGSCDVPHSILLYIGAIHTRLVFQFNSSSEKSPVIFAPYLHLVPKDLSSELTSTPVTLYGPTRTIPKRTLSYLCERTERYELKWYGRPIDDMSYTAYVDMRYIRAQAFTSWDKFRPAYNCVRRHNRKMATLARL